MNKNKTDLLERVDVDQNWNKNNNETMENDSDWNWRVEEFERDEGIYADIRVTDEGMTGYQGQHIWDQIYNNNCFKGDEEDLCFEKRILNRLIKGLHSSVSTHIAEYFVDFNSSNYDKFPNYELYF